MRNACGGDDALRCEVESLLAQASGASEFLSSPAAMATLVGQQIGVYRIVSLLGAGGMGEVYRARDTQLGRDVAIKVLPPMFTADADRLARFEREARMLATLNHPHIGAIYGLEDAPSTGSGQAPVRALVLELVEGETLADLLAHKTPSVEKSLHIARQIADAIDAAHEKGIVHRDLKPANIKITPSGDVKVLDFGLAKAMTGEGSAPDLSQSPTITVGGTREGSILGTASYMSPEQARGKPVDKRTDIWAFGCVLYEMLAGKRAFAGDTTSDTIAAILEREPDWTALPPALPRDTARLLHRCLEKDVKRRVRDIGDVAADLESAPAEVAPHADAHRARYGWIAAALAAVAIVAAIAAWLNVRPAPTVAPMNARVERITYDGGLSTMPAVSSDGTLIAYASNRSGRGDLDIWVQQATGTPLRVTDDPTGDTTPDFSPDGSQIVFRSERDGGGVYIVAALGGKARLIVPEGLRPKFSPDGTRVAYWAGIWRGTPSNGTSALFVISLLGGGPSRLLPEFIVARDPVWSPDGRSLVVLGRRDRTSPIAEALDWWWVPLDGRPPVKTGLYALANFRQGEPSPGAWTSSGVVFAAQGDLWAVPISTVDGRAGTPRRITTGAGAIAPAVARDGTITYAVNVRHRVVQRVPIGPGDNTRPVERLYRDNRPQAERVSQTADGSMIVLERGFDTYREIWQKRLSTGEEHMIARVDTPLLLNATVSPNGARVVFSVGPYGEAVGQVIDVAGGVPRTLCTGCALFGFLSDNRHVLGARDRSREIVRFDTMSETVTPLVRDPVGGLERGHLSPNDRWLAFRRARGASVKSYVTALTGDLPVNPDTANEIPEPTNTGRPAGWSLDSRILYLLLDSDGYRCLWAQNIDEKGALAGLPYVARHFHASSDLGQSIGTSYGNPISAGGFMYGDVEFTGDIFRLVGSVP